MRTLEGRFENFTIKQTGWSSYTCFVVAVAGRNFSRAIMAKWFNVLVEKDDYARADRKQLIEYLYLLTKGAEEKDFRG